MSDALTRRYPMSVKPRRWETEDSYTTRLLAANVETDIHLRHFLRLARKTDPAAVVTDVLIAKTGHTFHFGTTGDVHSTDEHHCDHCPETGRFRRMCTLCAEGDTVLQAAPFSNPVCIRHRRWVGIAGNVRQAFVDDDTVRAAIRFDKLRRSGRLTPALYDVLAAATRDAAHPDGSLVAVVEAAAAVTTQPFIGAMFAPGQIYADSYALLNDVITTVAPSLAAQLVRSLWSYFRPSFWALRHAFITDAPYEPGWEQDFTVPNDVAVAYLASHAVAPFADYTKAARTDQSTTALPVVLDRGGRVICDHGHPYEGKARACPVCKHSVVLAGYNDLATTHPLIAAELDPDINGTNTTRNIAAASHKSIAWRCPRARHVY